LSLDNLVSADVVLADGTFVTANARDHADLFWALRGGGGNFGIVTNFEYRLQPLRNVVAGPMFFEVEDAPRVMRAFDSYIGRAPRELGAFFAWQIAPPLPFIPQDRHGDTLCALVACWTGPADRANEALAPLRDAAPIVAEAVGPMPYPAINGAFDGLVPPGLQHYWKAVFAKGLSDEAIAVHAEHGPKVPVVNSTMHIYPINGAVHDVAPDATAFGHRDAKYAMVIAGMWPDPAQSEANTRWVKEYYRDLAPHAEKGGYINFAAGDDSNRVAANFGRNYGRLQHVKAKYDPDNAFRHNQNIAPAA
jgi:FAD/FMN-containing dehydrogenase